MFVFKDNDYVHTLKKTSGGRKPKRCKQSILPQQPKFEPPVKVIPGRPEKIVFTNAKGKVIKEVKNNRS